jgi:hypothetical protein
LALLDLQKQALEFGFATPRNLMETAEIILGEMDLKGVERFFNDYEIKCTVNSGTTPSGSSTGVWLPLSSTVQWYLFETGESSKTCNLTIAIRDAATQTEQGSRTTTITATVSY